MTKGLNHQDNIVMLQVNVPTAEAHILKYRKEKLMTPAGRKRKIYNFSQRLNILLSVIDRTRRMEIITDI